MKILWLGPLVSDEVMRRRPAALSPAGVRWNRSLVCALQSRGVEIRNLYHLPEPIWPRGRVYIGEQAPASISNAFGASWVSYWNLPVIRSVSLTGRYVAAFQALLLSFRPDAVITYNFLEQNDTVGAMARKIGIPWVNILADVYGDATLSQHDSVAALASGHVFLSWAAYQESKWHNRLHLDGGVGRVAEPCDEVPGRIVYTGALNALAGIDLLLKAFPKIKNPKANLVVCGKGSSKALEDMARRDSRISYLGLVSDDRLGQICRQASVLVNPRSPAFGENRYNFPSKLLEYISYGKPIVSTWTPGLAPTYRDLLICVESEKPEDLGAGLDFGLGMDKGRREHLAARLNKFSVDHSWDEQALRLIRWLRGLQQ